MRDRRRNIDRRSAKDRRTSQFERATFDAVRDRIDCSKKSLRHAWRRVFSMGFWHHELGGGQFISAIEQRIEIFVETGQ